ncbi:DUF1295 domain-containing protein [Chengkuizengella marina]|nr:DUF1295 domain-containing protein [Chengkuizengella marina]
MGELYLINSLVIFVYMVMLFLIALKIKDNSIIDINWGLGFVIISWSSMIITNNISITAIIVNSLITLWGIRLATHLWIRSIGTGEDFRYVNMRKAWGKNVVFISFFRIFMFQGAIMLLLSYPIMRANLSGIDSINFFMIAGIVVWFIGFIFQVVGDYQLSQFKKNRINKEQVLNTGLWRYTRHPNYFGEATMWWGIFLIIVTLDYGWIGLFSALFINFLLLRVSGVPFLDRRYKNNVEYQKYKQETSRFIPLPPKKISSQS